MQGGERSGGLRSLSTSNSKSYLISPSIMLPEQAERFFGVDGKKPQKNNDAVICDGSPPTLQDSRKTNMFTVYKPNPTLLRTVQMGAVSTFYPTPKHGSRAGTAEKVGQGVKGTPVSHYQLIPG